MTVREFITNPYFPPRFPRVPIAKFLRLAHVFFLRPVPFLATTPLLPTLHLRSSVPARAVRELPVPTFSAAPPEEVRADHGGVGSKTRNKQFVPTTYLLDPKQETTSLVPVVLMLVAPSRVSMPHTTLWKN